MAATARWRCPDCGHPMPMEFELEWSGSSLTVSGDQAEFTQRMRRHVLLNPDVHPTFALSE